MLTSVRSWREAGAEPVAVAPSYTKFVNEHMFPTSGADVSAACAVDGVCGGATGMVCPAGQYCDVALRACEHMSPAKRIALQTGADATGSGNDANYMAFSNNFGGACSSCSADRKCGPAAGGTVCGRAQRCDADSGACVAVSSLDAPDDFAMYFRDASHAMFPFGNNHGGACPERECAVNKRCGPIYGSKVCAAGLECSAGGVCDTMAASTVSAGADVVHSDNNFGRDQQILPATPSTRTSTLTLVYLVKRHSMTWRSVQARPFPGMRATLPARRVR